LKFLIGLIVIWISVGSSLLQAKDYKISDKQKHVINEYLDDAESKGVSGYLLIAIDNKVIVSRGIGRRNIELNQQNTADTVFDIGSNTKQFTAAAIMQLVEKGVIRLEQPLSDFFNAVSAEKASVTIHQLLTHSSGFENASGRDFEQLSKAEFLDQVLKSPLLPNSEQRYQYSNVGYSVLAAIIEKVSGQTYESYLTEHLFRPAGMTQTGYVLPKWHLDKVAIGYHRGFRNIGTVVERYQDDSVSWNLVGNGGIQSTTNDLYAWFRALQSGRVLSKSSIEIMLKQYVQHPKSDWYYGYGWGNGLRAGGEILAAHNGSNSVFWSSLYWMPKRGLWSSFSSNAEMDATTRFANEVIQVIIDESYKPDDIQRSPYWEVVNLIRQHKAANIKILEDYLTRNNLIIDDRHVLNRVGSWLLQSDSYHWAVEVFKKNVSLFPEDGNLHDSLGEAYVVIGLNQEARKSFELALSLAPKSGCHWCNNSKAQLSKIESQSK
jgi:CubicO group peptidase (beta-lactamase class C family)